MTGFTERTVHRALGASGRIQPRIAPITAPDPWISPGASDLGLEVYEEIEAPREPGARRVDGARARPEPEPRAETEGARMQQAPRSEVKAGDVDVPAPEQPAAQQVVAPPVVPSFRARTLELAASMLAPAASPVAPQVERLEGLEAEEIVVVPGAPRGAAAETLVRSDTAPAAPAETSVLRSASRLEHATEVLATRAPSMRAATTELHDAPWASPMPLLEPAMPVRRGRREAEASGPVVRIEIGKVELRAPSPAPEPVPATIAKPEAFVSLQQYLHKRGAS